MNEAIIILEDQTQWSGYSFGADRSCAGEIVFNTGMVGYLESLTDPSYRGQLLTLTYPLIGNYGVPDFRADLNHLHPHFESHHIQPSALIVSQYVAQFSHGQAKHNLGTWLKEEGIVGISGVDTRSLTKHLRQSGTMCAKIVLRDDIDWYRPEDHHLVAQSSCTQRQTFGTGSKHVVLIDCGVKHNIIRHLIKRDIRVTLVPWDDPFTDLSVDGIFISNGPGDPRHCQKTIAHLRYYFGKSIPIFGICMGHQLLAMAAGADIFKLRYGHRSQNQPVIEIGTDRCLITAQNHGYAVDETTLPKDWACWFKNLNDDTCAGIKHTSGLYKGVQFHPEASPGPKDAQFFFDTFRTCIEECT